MYNNKTSRIKFLLIAIIVIGLTSCHTYKNLVEPPKIDTQGIVRDGEANKGDTTTIANIPWKEYFTDPNLQLLISEGIDKNINLQIAIRASSRVKQALAWLEVHFSPL